jgi:hypothetical protein
MSYVIFTIDFEHDPQRMNVFMNYIADCQREGTMQGNCLPMLGCYKGKRENSFIIDRDDYLRCISDTRFMAGQESILHVASGNKMEVHIEYLADGRVEFLGSMHQVCREEAEQAEAWTYRPDMKCYWIAKKGNPDNSYSESVARYRMPATDEHV